MPGTCGRLARRDALSTGLTGSLTDSGSLGAALAFSSALAALRTEGNRWFPSVTSFPLVVCRSRKSDTLLAAVIGPPSSDARAVHSIMTFTPSGRRAPHTVRAGGGSGKKHA